MASFNELYESVFGQDGVKSQIQKKEKLVNHYSFLSRERAHDAKVNWNNQYKKLTVQDEYKSLDRQCQELSKEIKITEQRLEKLYNDECNITDQIDMYVYNRIGSKPRDEPDKLLDDQLENVARLYKLDRMN